MTEHLSIEEFRKLQGRVKHKYQNQVGRIDGKRFDSKLESERYLTLKNWWQVGAIRWFTRQVPFDLPGGIKYRADFLVVWATQADHFRPAGELVTIEDCKGYMTRLSQTKIRQVEDLYKLKIKIITRENINGR